MNPEQQRIAIAEACGWTNIRWNGVRYNWVGHRPETARDDYALPDYLNDLNAMHDAEKTMGDAQLWVEYQSYLSDAMEHVGWLYHATAAQRAKAFLKTLNLWKP
jgi:hypothetical protein